MKSRAVVVGLYLLLDLVTPGLPGAFAFEPQESIEVARAQRAARAHLPSPADINPPAVLPSFERVSLDVPRVVAPMAAVRFVVALWSPPPRSAVEPVTADPAAA